MSLKQQCMDNISKTIGRRLTVQEGDAILGNIKDKMRVLRKADPAKWATMRLDDRIRAAGAEVAVDIEKAAAAKKKAQLKQVLRQNELVREMERLAKEDNIHAYAAVARILQGVYSYARGIQNEYLTNMLDTLHGIRSEWLGFVENAEDVRDFVREAFGENTGNERARKAWQAFNDTAEQMRQRAVDAGADIGKLDYGYIPQSHDWWKVRRAGAQEWIDFIFPLLDRERFVRIDGELMSDGEIRDMLSGAYDDIVTSGNSTDNLFEIARTTPQRVGERYKKYQHRTLHFKDANSFLTYEKRFGQGSLTGALVGHVAKMSNDIAILERMGPRAQGTFSLLRDMADSVAENARMTESSWKLLRKYSDWQGLTDASIEDMWNVLRGVTSRAAVNREGVANFMAGWRNLEVAGKLGKAFITSFSDIPSYFVATGFNRLDLMQGFRFLFQAYGADWKDYANRAGFIADSVASDFNRWGSDNIGQGWTAKMANATIRASFLNAFTDATRRAFCLNMMAGLAKMVKYDWDLLDDYDRARLQAGGITKQDWAVLQAVGVDTHRGIDFVTIEKIKQYAQKNPGTTVAQLPSKLIAFIVQESEMASLNPDLVTRAETTRGLERGTFKGEIARSLALFKSFPIAMMEKHFRRASFLWHHSSRVNSIGYVAGLFVATTVFGGISLQIQNLLNGKDAQDMVSWNFVLQSMSKGGGLGFLGDYLVYGLSEDSRYGAMSGAANIAGPIAGTVIEASDVLLATTQNAIYDKETQPGAKALRLVRSHTPFVNMWYTSTVLDRAVMNELQEYLSPGYLRRMETRQRRGTGQGYWWPMGQSTPNRAPRMADQPNR